MNVKLLIENIAIHMIKKKLSKKGITLKKTVVKTIVTRVIKLLHKECFFYP